MINPSIFIGAPLYFKDICKIYPPSVKDVVSNPQYAQWNRLLTITMEDIKDQFKAQEEVVYPTPLEFLLINCHYNKQFLTIAHAALEFFLREPVTFLEEQKMIVIGTREEIEERGKKQIPFRALNEDNYFDFQNLIRTACGDKVVKPPEPEDPNEDPRIRRIKQKARERDRIKARQGNKSGITLDTILVSICCMGLGITPLNIGEMSYASISELIRVYQDKEKYDLDVRSLLAGADSKKIKPKYWIRNTD